MVQPVIKKLKQFSKTETLHGHGRKSKLSPQTAQKLCHGVNINPRIVLKYITKNLDMMGISVTVHTIQHSLVGNEL